MVTAMLPQSLKLVGSGFTAKDATCFVTLRTVFVLAGIIGDASAVVSQQVLDYVPYTLKLASFKVLLLQQG
jgi:hypothetical protein